MRTFEWIARFHHAYADKVIDDPKLADFYVRTIELSKKRLLEDVQSNKKELRIVHMILDECELIKQIALSTKAEE